MAATELALNNPLIDDIHYKELKGWLVNITGEVTEKFLKLMLLSTK